MNDDYLDALLEDTAEKLNVMLESQPTRGAALQLKAVDQSLARVEGMLKTDYFTVYTEDISALPLV